MTVATLKNQMVRVVGGGSYQTISRTVSKVKQYDSGVLQGEVSIKGCRYVVSRSGDMWSVIRGL